MQLIEHRCPKCGFAELAPVVRITPGDAGMWHCGDCGNAYAVWIEFRAVSEELLQQRRVELIAQTSLSPSDTDAAEGNELDQRKQRLQEIDQQVGRLQSSIDELEAEARQLQAGGN